jgi:hypothetical protein
VAFTLLLVQGIAGFPVRAEILETQKKSAASWEGMAGGGVLDEMMGGLKKQVAQGLRVRLLPWFGLELGALALPTLMLAILLARSSASAPLPSLRTWSKLEPDER